MKNYFVFLILTNTLMASASEPADYFKPIPELNIKVDKINLTEDEQRVIMADFKRMQRLEIQAPKGSLFDQVFGGTDIKAVLSYLDERIDYITAPYDQRKSNVIASNYSGYWLQHYASKFFGRGDDYGITFRFGRGKVQLNSPREGYMAIGASYGSHHKDEDSGLNRLDTLVHEARHSDCPQLPNKKDLLAFFEDRYGDISHKGQLCTYGHTACNAKERKEGVGTCDANPYGAYMVGYIFARAIVDYCVNCTKLQKKQARASARLDYDHIHPRYRSILKMKNPPKPDMSSL